MVNTDWNGKSPNWGIKPTCFVSLLITQRIYQVTAALVIKVITQGTQSDIGMERKKIPR